MIELFSINRVNKSPASFDPQKLMAFQADDFAALSEQQRLDAVRPFAQSAGLLDGEGAETKLAAVVVAAEDRLKVAGDIVDFDFCFIDDISYDQKAFQKRIVKPENACELLTQFRDIVEGADKFDAASAETLLKEFCESAEIKIGQIIHAIRVATTGQPAGFGMFDTLAILGKEKVIERIDHAIAAAK